MWTYKDKTYCAYGDKCKKLECHRKLTEEDKTIIKAKEYLVAYAKFNDCKDKPKEEKNGK